MTLFNNKININEGKKYDTSQVSMDGISKEELAEIEKKNKKLIDVYKALGAGDGMSSIDLAKAMDGFSKMDTSGDGKLSKEELEKGAVAFNKEHGTNIEGKDLKAFMKSIRKATKDDTKVSTDGVLKKEASRVKLQNDVDVAVNQFLGDLDAKSKAREEADAAKAKAEADAKEAADAEAKAKADDLKTPKSYTVQPNERLDGILKRSLEAQGLDVNDENMAQAKADFIKNNPGALHGPKGKEYLYAADVIKVAGNLEDKANGDEITDDFKAKQNAAKAEAEAKAKAEAEAKAKAEAEAAKKAQDSEPSVNNTRKVLSAYPNGNPKSTLETKKNKDGTETVVTVNYDENKKVKNSTYTTYTEVNGDRLPKNVIERNANFKRTTETDYVYLDDGTLSISTARRFDLNSRVAKTIEKAHYSDGDVYTTEQFHRLEDASVYKEVTKNGDYIITVKRRNSDGTGSQYSEFVDPEKAEKPGRRINYDKNWGQIESVIYTYGKDGTSMATFLDKDDEPTGKVNYYNKNNNKMPKQEYEKLQ